MAGIDLQQGLHGGVVGVDGGLGVEEAEGAALVHRYSKLYQLFPYLRVILQIEQPIQILYVGKEFAALLYDGGKAVVGLPYVVYPEELEAPEELLGIVGNQQLYCFLIAPEAEGGYKAEKQRHGYEQRQAASPHGNAPLLHELLAHHLGLLGVIGVFFLYFCQLRLNAVHLGLGFTGGYIRENGDAPQYHSAYQYGKEHAVYVGVYPFHSFQEPCSQKEIALHRISSLS